MKLQTYAQKKVEPFMQHRNSFSYMWQVRVNNVPNHRWRLTRKAFLGGGGAPPDPLNQSAAIAASASQEGPTVIALVGRRRILRRPVFGVMSKMSQDHRLVRMIWVKDQHAQHWSWTRSKWR